MGSVYKTPPPSARVQWETSNLHLTLMGEGLLRPGPGGCPSQLLTGRVIGEEDVECVGAVQMKQVSQLPDTQVRPAVETYLVVTQTTCHGKSGDFGEWRWGCGCTTNGSMPSLLLLAILILWGLSGLCFR